MAELVIESPCQGLDCPNGGPYATLTVTCPLLQSELEALLKLHGKTLSKIGLEHEFRDDAAELHFTNDLMNYLPALEALSLTCVNATILDFAHPKLRNLSLEHMRDVQEFNLTCPSLESLDFEFVELKNPETFGASVSCSPLLRNLRGYKLWGLGVDSMRRCHNLVLPKCETISLYRSDDLDFLRLYAPNMIELNLQACYSLKYVEILNEPPAEYRQQCPHQQCPKNFRVNLINASRDFHGNLMRHPRNIAPKAYVRGDPFRWLMEGHFDPEKGFIGTGSSDGAGNWDCGSSGDDDDLSYSGFRDASIGDLYSGAPAEAMSQMLAEAIMEGTPDEDEMMQAMAAMMLSQGPEAAQAMEEILRSADLDQDVDKDIQYSWDVTNNDEGADDGYPPHAAWDEGGVEEDSRSVRGRMHGSQGRCTSNSEDVAAALAANGGTVIIEELPNEPVGTPDVSLRHSTFSSNHMPTYNAAPASQYETNCGSRSEDQVKVADGGEWFSCGGIYGDRRGPKRRQGVRTGRRILKVKRNTPRGSG